jgi:hypothetical protein
MVHYSCKISPKNKNKIKNKEFENQMILEVFNHQK